jgi:hypothetical protein
MDPNCKPIHASAYTVPRSVEQKSQQSKEIVRLVDIGFLEEDYSSEWASCIPSFAIPKKKRRMTVGDILQEQSFSFICLAFIH